MTLQEEFSSAEYNNLSNKERLELVKSKTTRVVGRIEQGKLKVLEAIIANGLWRDKMEDMKANAKLVLVDTASTAEQKALANLKMKIVAGFHEAISEAKMANKASFELGGHTINMNDASVSQTFNAAATVGLITSTETAQVLELAKYDKQSFPDVTFKDVISYFNPELLSDEWFETEVTDSRLFTVRLNSKAPEQTYILIQWQDGIGDWYHATALHGIEAVKSYKAQLPYDGESRKLRWRCAYALDCVVSL
jgi:hypothetical protein